MLIDGTTSKVVGFEDELRCGRCLGNELQHSCGLRDNTGTLRVW